MVTLPTMESQLPPPGDGGRSATKKKLTMTAARSNEPAPQPHVGLASEGDSGRSDPDWEDLYQRDCAGKGDGEEPVAQLRLVTSTECTKRRKAPWPLSSYWRRADKCL